MGETSDEVHAMPERTGFDVQQRGAVEVTNGWPDVETAVRAHGRSD